MGYKAIPEMRKSYAREIARLAERFPRKHSLGSDPQILQNQVPLHLWVEKEQWVEGHFWLDSDF